MRVGGAALLGANTSIRAVGRHPTDYRSRRLHTSEKPHAQTANPDRPYSPNCRVYLPASGAPGNTRCAVPAHGRFRTGAQSADQCAESHDRGQWGVGGIGRGGVIAGQVTGGAAPRSRRVRGGGSRAGAEVLIGGQACRARAHPGTAGVVVSPTAKNRTRPGITAGPRLGQRAARNGQRRRLRDGTAGPSRGDRITENTRQPRDPSALRSAQPRALR